jgi:hypothetical protein
VAGLFSHSTPYRLGRKRKELFGDVQPRRRKEKDAGQAAGTGQRKKRRSSAARALQGAVACGTYQPHACL